MYISTRECAVQKHELARPRAKPALSSCARIDHNPAIWSFSERQHLIFCSARLHITAGTPILSHFDPKPTTKAPTAVDGRRRRALGFGAYRGLGLIICVPRCDFPRYLRGNDRSLVDLARAGPCSRWLFHPHITRKSRGRDSQPSSLPEATTARHDGASARAKAREHASATPPARASKQTRENANMQAGGAGPPRRMRI